METSTDPKADTAAQAAAQAAVVRLLADPATHGPDVDAVERHDTHISRVFLAGDLAYKMKRAVAFAYLDFATLARRRVACAAELRLNRRTAPELYLGLCPVLEDAGGDLYLGALVDDTAEAPAAVEWLVVMRRFDTASLLSEIVAGGTLQPAQIEALAAHVAAFHEAAPPVERDPVAGHAGEIAGNTAAFGAAPELFDPEAVARLDADSRAALSACAPVLARRAAAGWVRHGHGDLHLRNIVMLAAGPRLFDAIEFDPALAEIDVMYDLAFALMDFDHRGVRWAANRLLSGYMNRLDTLDGLALLPLALSLRAAIRAKVAAHTGQTADAAAYFAAAQTYLRPAGPCLVAVGGVSGTGKTTLARHLAPDLGPAPGAVLIRSDVERKCLFGVAETERLPESAYRGEINARVYARMYARAETALAAGHGVVLEATFLRREDRARVRRLAETAGVPWCGLWLTAPDDTLKARVAARAGDASDATPSVVAAQLEHAPKGPTAWRTVAAAGTPEEAAARAREALAMAGLTGGRGTIM